MPRGKTGGTLTQREVFAASDIGIETRADGSIILESRPSPGRWGRSIPSVPRARAHTHPDRTPAAQRDHENRWISLTYGEARIGADALAQAVLENLNLVRFHGGALYIDDGKPTPALFGRTLAALRDISPTLYFNVPACGAAADVPLDDPCLRDHLGEALARANAGAGSARACLETRAAEVDRLDALDAGGDIIYPPQRQPSA